MFVWRSKELDQLPVTGREESITQREREREIEVVGKRLVKMLRDWENLRTAGMEAGTEENGEKSINRNGSIG